MFFVMSSGSVPCCPRCSGTLRYRDSRLRIRRKEGGITEHFRHSASGEPGSCSETASSKTDCRNKRSFERTLYRYEKAYQMKQFSGLKPADREKQRSQKLPENFGQILEQAIQLRKEVPERSVSQIICILEMEGYAGPGILKRSTLERYLYRAGFGKEQMQMYRDARQSSSKRFCKPHRMMLIQADIKYGPKLPIGKNGAKVQTYLSSAIDDHSRMLLSSRFYDNQEETIVEDTLHQAILRYGKFDAFNL